MLRQAEFRLCSHSSPSGNAGRAVIEHQAGGTRFRRHSAPISRRLDIAAIAAGCVSGDRLPAGGADPCLLAMLLSFLVGRVRSLLLLFSFALAAFLRSLCEFLRQFLHWVLVSTVLVQQVHRPCSFRRRRLSFSRMLRFCLCMSLSFNQEGRRSGCGHSSGFGLKTTVQVYLCVPEWPGNAPLLQKRTGGH